MAAREKLPRLMRAVVFGASLALAGLTSGANAQLGTGVQAKLPYSPIPGHVRPAGLWDKPNEICMNKCQEFVQKGCFKRLSDKDPTADPASIQDQCEDKFSLCLYDCMCDTCDENQIIIRQ